MSILPRWLQRPVTGPDCSSHQHDSGQPIDWGAVKRAGHSFVIVKATQNDGYVNPFFVQDVRDAQAAGLLAMPYHYMGPAPASQQVGALLAIVRQVFDSGPIWLDYEEHSTHAILHEMERELDATPFRPGTYTYPDWWANNGDPTCQLCSRHPLWWADYNAGHNRPAPAPWSQVALRQTHGTSYAVPGLPGLNDMSRAEVDLATILTPPDPLPKPKPVPADLGDRMLVLINGDPHLWEAVGSELRHINAAAWAARSVLRKHNNLPDEKVLHVNPHDPIALLPKVTAP